MKKRTCIFILCIGFLIIVLFIFNFPSQKVDYVLKEKTDISKSMRSVVFKSFQTVDQKKYDQVNVLKQIRSVASVYKNKNLIKKNIISGVEKEISKPTFQLNGNKYYWLSDYEAKLSPGLVNENFANGYEVKKLSKDKINFEIFNQKSLQIVQSGPSKKIVTGAFIVQYKSKKDVEDFASQIGLLVLYQAPQIQTLIFQAQDGQDLFQILSKLKSFTNINYVEMELLGQGVAVQ